MAINFHELTVLIDSCSSDSFISENSVKQLGLEIQPSSRNISIAFTTINISITGCCIITITLGDNVYNGIRLSTNFAKKRLCVDYSQTINLYTELDPYPQTATSTKPPTPTSGGLLRRALGMFVYYAKWIPDFSDKITALTNANVFPLSPTPLVAFNNLMSSNDPHLHVVESP